MLWNVFNLTELNEKNTFILDDYIEVYRTQKKNAIFAPEFQYLDDNSENDIFLKYMIKNLKKLKKNIKKISKINKKIYKRFKDKLIY